MLGREQVTSIVWAVVFVVSAFVLAGVALEASGSANTLEVLTAMFGGLAAITALFIAILKALGISEIRSGVQQANHALNGELTPRIVDAASEANAPIEAQIREIKVRLNQGDDAFEGIRTQLAGISARLETLTSCEVKPQ